MAKPRDDRQKDLLRPALEEIIDLGHPLVRLAREIDWGFLDRRFAGVCTAGSGSAAAADPVGSGAVDPEAHARPVGRGAVRALAGEPVLPVLLRRIELLPPAAVRPLVADALAPAAGRGGAGGAAPGEPVGGAQDRGAGDPRSRAGGGRHHGPAEGDRPSDRRAAVPPGAGEAGRSRTSATMCRCGRAIAGWPSAPRSWSDATPTRTSSSAPGGR